MNIDVLLSKEGITNIYELEAQKIRTISTDIAIKLCLAFPEHNLNRQQLYNSFCRLNMYTATMPNDSSGAKYVPETNSIYFNKDLDYTQVPDTAMHECIHFLQHNNLTNPNNYLGLTGLTSGLALNEAAVQLMAAEANMNNITEEKYFNILIKTNSPDYYPLECALVNQLAYFTGTYPLYHSILYNDEIFKNTFIAKFNKRIYNRISRQLDKLLYLENELNYYIKELEYSEKVNNIKQLNNIINDQKNSILKLFFNIQNFIIRNCFTYEFNNIRNAEDLYNFKYRLYEFKNIMGTTDNYTFYNNFYCDLMNALEQKQEEIKKYKEISLFKTECTALAVVDNTKYTFKFIHTFIRKIRKLFKLNKSSINDYID